MNLQNAVIGSVGPPFVLTVADAARMAEVTRIVEDLHSVEHGGGRVGGTFVVAKASDYGVHQRKQVSL